MFVRRSLLALPLAFMVVGCADQPTGLNNTVRASETPLFLQWAGKVAPQFSATSSTHQRGDGRGGKKSPPISLDRYQSTFWAVRGKARSIQINYQSSIDDATHPFLRLTTSDPEFAPGVGAIAKGDSVLITVTVDTTMIGVKFEPSGLQFGRLSELKIWYGGASGDMNGDAVVDSTDAQIEQQLLGLWYREGDNDAWTKLSASQNVGDKAFTYALPHFCWYAIAAVRELAVSW